VPGFSKDHLNLTCLKFEAEFMIRMLEMQTMRIALQKDTVIKKEILKQEVIDLTNDDDDDDYGAKI
jgi:hypothetical protein